MLDHLVEILKKDTICWNRFKNFFVKRQIAAKTVLLKEGEISGHAHLIKEGCLRLWFNKDGKDITFQFFFEGQGVSSMDSFFLQQPSLFTLESLESSIIYSIERERFEELLKLFPEIIEGFQDYIFQRLRNYAGLFLSRIKDTPGERYESLVKNHPEIIQRIPQHYIASYLGITPISLSRIRNRK